MTAFFLEREKKVSEMSASLSDQEHDVVTDSCTTPHLSEKLGISVKDV